MIKAVSSSTCPFSRREENNSVDLVSKSVESIELCNVIEVFLIDSMPSIDRSTARHLAQKLSSLKIIQQSIDTSGGVCIKDCLKKVSRILLRVANDKRRAKSNIHESSLPASKRSVTTPLVEKSAIVAPPAYHQSNLARCHSLVNKMGDAKYDEIVRITQEIEDIRRNSGVWQKFSNDFSKTNEEQIYEKSFEEERLPASKALPSPIYNIYFRTRLVDAMRVVKSQSSRQMEEVTENGTCIVQRMNWDELLQDAKENLHAFRQFEKENVTEEDDLSFKCGSGMCYPVKKSA